MVDNYFTPISWIIRSHDELGNYRGAICLHKEKNMTIETVIYLANILPKFQILGLFSTLGFIGSVMGLTFSYVEDVENIRKPLFISLFIAIFLGILVMLIPAERTIYLMLGANYLKTSALPTKVEMAIEKKIDSYVMDDKEKK